MERWKFEAELEKILDDAGHSGLPYRDVTGAELHRRVGGYPGTDHRMPVACGVLRSTMADGDLVLRAPRCGNGATLAIRFFLPRRAA